MKLQIIFSVCLACLWLNTIAQIINVPADQPTIQAGIDAATDGDTVLVADGNYLENINFMGKTITIASNFIMNGDTNHITKTLIDGSQPADPDYGSVVTFNTGEDTTSVLSGFTITRGTGMLDTVYGFRMGGGIMCYNASAKIVHNIITGNVASNPVQSMGGGILSYLTKCFISGNIISHDTLIGDNNEGGGVVIYLAAQIDFFDNTITHNSHNPTVFSKGAGLYCSESSGMIRIKNNEFSYNYAPTDIIGAGGGLCIWDADESSNIIVSENRFHNNTAHFGGGVHERSCYRLYFSNNIFSGNSSFGGGSIFMFHPTTKSGLTSSDTRDFHPRIINNTFFSNSASLTGGGAVFFQGALNAPEIVNCIFWDNTAPIGRDIRNYNNLPITVSYCDINTNNIEGPWTGEENINADPQFIDGDTLFHLSQSSPCRDTGKAYLYTPNFDYDGDSRPDPVFGLVDMGADEFYEIPNAPVALDPEDIVGDSFVAAWSQSLWTQGYYLDVAWDENYDSILPAYNNLDVGVDTFQLIENLDPDSSYYYRVRAYNGSGTSPNSNSISVLSVNVDEMQVKDQNVKIRIYPNPCSATTNISYLVQVLNKVEIGVYNLNGEELYKLVDNEQAPGKHTIHFDTSYLPAGIYLIRSQVGKDYTTSKLIIMR